MATSTERVLKSRKKDRKLGRKRKEYPVTDEEHKQIKALLLAIRSE